MSDLKKIRVQHVERDSDGKEIKTDVDVYTDAEAVTMDGKDLKTRLGEIINARVGEIIDGAPKELDTLKELADELQKNQSGVSTILSKLENKQDKISDVSRLKTNAYNTSSVWQGISNKRDVEDWIGDLAKRTVELRDDLNNKVNKEAGKVLSSNDFTNKHKEKLDSIPSDAKFTDTTYDLSKYILKSELSNLDGKKVTSGSGASVWGSGNREIEFWIGDFDKRTKENRDNLKNKVDSVSGKGLSSNDYTNADRDKVRAIPSNPKYTDTVPDLSGYAKTTDLSKYALKVEVSKQDLSNYATKKDLKSIDLSGYAKTRDLVTEARIREIAAEIAYADYLFTSGDLYKKLNNAFKTNFSSSIKTTKNLVDSKTAMTELINNPYALQAAFRSFEFNGQMANSSTAMNAVLNSSTAMNAVLNSSTAMNAVANSSTAMNAVANSSTAMNAVLNSSTAMNAVLNSSIAMNAVANSSTAMNAVANSSTAMNAMYDVPISTLKKVCRRDSFYMSSYVNIYGGPALVLFFEEDSNISQSYNYIINSPKYYVEANLTGDKIKRFVKKMNSLQVMRNISNSDGYSYVYYIPLK